MGHGGSEAISPPRAGIFHKRNPFHSRKLGLKRNPSKDIDSPKGVIEQTEKSGLKVEETPVQNGAVEETPGQKGTVDVASAPSAIQSEAPVDKLGEQEEDAAADAAVAAVAASFLHNVLADAYAGAEADMLVRRAVEDAVDQEFAAEAAQMCAGILKCATDELESERNEAAAQIVTELVKRALDDIETPKPTRPTSANMAAVAMRLAPSWRKQSGLWGKLRAFGPELASILREANFETETADENPFRWE